MFNLLQRARQKYNRMLRSKNEQKINKFAREYIKLNNLDKLLESADNASTSTGAELPDYVALHSYILQYKPTYILECGTGKSTWILAHALQKNHLESGVLGKVISMESVDIWYNEAKKIFPSELQQYVEFHYSPATTYQYSIIRGTCFTKVPDYQYDLFFVDGPELTVTHDGYSYDTANMDFIRYLITAIKPATAIIDTRMRTCAAYGLIFGQKKVKYLRGWMLGIIENVTKKDLKLNNSGLDMWKILGQSTDLTLEHPSWLRNKV